VMLAAGITPPTNVAPTVAAGPDYTPANAKKAAQ